MMAILVFGLVAGVLVLLGISQMGKDELKQQLRRLRDDVDELRARLDSLEPGTTHTKTLASEPVRKPVINEPSKPAPPVAMAPAPAVTRSPTAQASRGTLDEWFEKVWSWIVNYFTQGNTVVRIGAIVLFFGVSFLLKYTADAGILPIELRLIGAGLFGIALFFFGMIQFKKREHYAIGLEGAGIGILFITLFMGMKLYFLIPAAAGFIALVVLAGLTGFVSAKQNSVVLALIATIGGFLAPILASTGEGNHIILFSYYLLLNLAVFSLAWVRTWRLLNVVSFAFTYLVSTSWGAMRYGPDLFASAQPFLIGFFAIYLIIPILYAFKKRSDSSSAIDSTLIFGNPIIAFGLQTQLVKSFEYGAASSSIVLALLYLGLFQFLRADRFSGLRLLRDSFLSLAVVFGTIAIPLAFDGHWTAAIWGLEAAAVYWIAVRQERMLPRFFSYALSILAGFVVLSQPSGLHGAIPFLNHVFMGRMMLAIGALAIASLAFVHQEKLLKEEKIAAGAFSVFGAVWLLFAGYWEARTNIPLFVRSNWDGLGLYLDRSIGITAGVLFFSATVLVLRQLVQRFSAIRFEALLFSFSPLLFLMYWGMSGRLPFEGLGFVAWPVAFFSAYSSLGTIAERSPRLKEWGHAILFWVLAWMGWDTLEYGAKWFIPGHYVWVDAISFIAPVTAIFVSVRLSKKESVYLGKAVYPILALVWISIVVASPFNRLDMKSMTYLPFLNPVEIVEMLGIWSLTRWYAAKQEMSLAQFLTPKRFGLVLGATIFIFVNTTLLRSVHHFGDVPFDFSTMFRSVLVQSSLSIYWSLIAISLMIFANKRTLRWLWVTGTSLVGVTVLKLFLIDLSNTETIERIVTFLSVGVLLLVVGYFAPIPPREESRSKP